MSEAIERAAHAWFDRQQATRMDAGAKRGDGKRWQWEDITEHDRRAYRAIVQPIVQAALQEDQ
jgi:hypothetical protein